MAVSEAGARLTATHKVAQSSTAAAASMQVGAVFANKFPKGGSDAFLREALKITYAGERKAQLLAIGYFRDFSLAEARAGVVLPKGLNLDVAAPGNLPLIHNLHFLRKNSEETYSRVLRLGGSEDDALHHARLAVEATTYHAVATEGRKQILRQVGPKGSWRRVTDGNPCSFCAMLATRGEVYGGENADFPAHYKCGCTAEPVYSSWVPSELEARWAAAYEQAAALAKRFDNASLMPVKGAKKIAKSARMGHVTWRMNRIDPWAFKTGVVGTPARRLECSTVEWRRWWSRASKRNPDTARASVAGNLAVWDRHSRLVKFHADNFWLRGPVARGRKVSVETTKARKAGKPFMSSRSTGRVENLSGFKTEEVRQAVGGYQVTEDDIVKNIFGKVKKNGKLVGQHAWVEKDLSKFSFHTFASPEITPDDFMRRGLLTMSDPDFIAINDYGHLLVRRDIEGTIWEAQLEHSLKPDGTLKIDRIFSMYPKSGPDAFLIKDHVYIEDNKYNKRLLTMLEPSDDGRG